MEENFNQDNEMNIEEEFTEEKEVKLMCGFWRRIGALLIDSIILGVFGLVLGLFFEETFVEIGGFGRLIGFSVALIYFGLMNSSVASGQTIGKKILKIRVVNSDNKPINLIKSLGRYSVIGVPFFLNGAQFKMQEMPLFALYIIGIVVFGGMLSTVYLYVFNRVTRQSLHDLVFSTYVVNIGIGNSSFGKVWTPHKVIVALLFIAPVITIFFTSNLMQQKPFVDLLKVQEALGTNPIVNNVGVMNGVNIFSSLSSGTKKTTYIRATVLLGKDQISNSKLAREFAVSLAKVFPEAYDKDVIGITLVYGYDIGIFSRWNNYQYNFNPLEIRDGIKLQ